MRPHEAVPGVKWDAMICWLFDVRDSCCYHGRVWYRWNSLGNDVMDAAVSRAIGCRVRIKEVDPEKGILVEVRA